MSHKTTVRRRGAVTKQPAVASRSQASSSLGVGLARALSKWGVCSRSQAEARVSAGTVMVGQKVVKDPHFRIDMRRDRISVDGVAIQPALRVYLMLNKPRGIVTSAADEQGRATIYECLADPTLPWVGPVGRLDKASEGLLLLTNDTRWGAALLAPQSHVDKRYHVQIDRVPDAALCRQLERGLVDAEGIAVRAKQAAILRAGQRHGWLDVVLDEGKNRHIRRLLSALGIDVLRLVRVAVGPVVLGDLGKGAWRHLSPAEVTALRLAGGED
jgi:23S rRNA pseudouridine2605 synthase